MFSFLDETGTLGLRLSEPDRADFERTHGLSPMMQHGRTMKDYVSIPAHLLADTSQLAAWLTASHDWVSASPAKPTTRATR